MNLRVRRQERQVVAGIQVFLELECQRHNII